MSVTYIPAILRREVEARAQSCCEYCLLPDGLSFFPHEIDHVVAEKHGGATLSANLALTCWRCNRYKGTDLGSFDPQTGSFAFLFNPRTQNWADHFQLPEAFIEPLTPEARTTVFLLRLNNPERQVERRRLIEQKRYP